PAPCGSFPRRASGRRTETSSAWRCWGVLGRPFFIRRRANGVPWRHASLVLAPRRCHHALAGERGPRRGMTTGDMKLRFEHGSRDDLKTLHPAYFALVMATGIVALAADLHGLDLVATALFWLNAVF